MKRLLSVVTLLIPLLLGTPPASAQSGKVPPFRMLMPDGRVFRAEDLPMDKPIIIMYFSPECTDCLQTILNMLARMDDFNSASIVLITHYPPENVADFVADFYLENYSNIYVGTEGTSYFVRDHYSISELPFMVLHNKEGNMVSYYPEPDLNDLVEKLDNL